MNATKSSHALMSFLYVFHTLCHKICAQDPFGKNYLAYITVNYDYVWDLQCAGLHWFNEFHILYSCCLNKCYIIDALYHILCSNCQHVKSTENNNKELLYKGRGGGCMKEREQESWEVKEKMISSFFAGVTRERSRSTGRWLTPYTLKTLWQSPTAPLREG